jgi:osmotically inducible lipoprotein OsmB
MRKFLLLAALTIGLAGCYGGHPQNEPALVGGLLGAGGGAIIGGAVTGRPAGALAGAVIGGIGGAVVGDAYGRDRRYNNRQYDNSCVTYDEYGQAYYSAC